MYYDNISMVHLSQNSVHHQRTKHVKIDIHFIQEKFALGELWVIHVPTQLQFADIMTKGLPTLVFEEFRSSLCILARDTQTEGAPRF
jgi:hypothetical protein